MKDRYQHVRRSVQTTRPFNKRELRRLIKNGEVVGVKPSELFESGQIGMISGIPLISDQLCTACGATLPGHRPTQPAHRCSCGALYLWQHSSVFFPPAPAWVRQEP